MESFLNKPEGALIVKYGFGTIQVEAEILEERDTVFSLSHIRERYEHLQSKQKEHLYAVFLKNDKQVIGDKLISLGQSLQTSIDTKDIVRTAVLTDAEAAILVHNHTSANSQPSDADLEATRQVQNCLESFGVELLDHIILSRNQVYSMKAQGELSE
jgi:DNA repair protein RadC